MPLITEVLARIPASVRQRGCPTELRSWAQGEQYVIRVELTASYKPWTWLDCLGQLGWIPELPELLVKSGEISGCWCGDWVEIPRPLPLESISMAECTGRFPSTKEFQRQFLDAFWLLGAASEIRRYAIRLPDRSVCADGIMHDRRNAELDCR